MGEGYRHQERDRSRKGLLWKCVNSGELNKKGVSTVTFGPPRLLPPYGKDVDSIPKPVQKTRLLTRKQNLFRDPHKLLLMRRREGRSFWCRRKSLEVVLLGTQLGFRYLYTYGDSDARGSHKSVITVRCVSEFVK